MKHELAPIRRNASVMTCGSECREWLATKSRCRQPSAANRCRRPWGSSIPTPRMRWTGLGKYQKRLMKPPTRIQKRLGRGGTKT